MILPTTQKKPNHNHNHNNPNNRGNNQQTWYDRQKRRWDGSGRRQTASALTSTRPSARTRRSTSWPSSWARARRCVNLWIERWRRCIFMIFYFKTVFSSYKTARISVHIRPLFIWIERLLIGCVSYISKVKINTVNLR